MLSTPPAIISSASAVLMARAAVPTASRPEPHKRLTVGDVKIGCDEVDATKSRVKRREEAKNIVTSMT
jgi:hypothetical protein